MIVFRLPAQLSQLTLPKTAVVTDLFCVIITVLRMNWMMTLEELVERGGGEGGGLRPFERYNLGLT